MNILKSSINRLFKKKKKNLYFCEEYKKLIKKSITFFIKKFVKSIHSGPVLVFIYILFQMVL